ncbi:BgTH12-03764 [Blumeria graminis f. sp. triticale]|uniref:BgtA-20421 n=3 Tax=Blumeria graminis TaxID=34373 RepID=A0A9X9PR02_BLUGR|nr:hypothetical protein BGT96224_A20421 [Blumeria graminis f. sp. tritici 96224]CAD6499656.1 BgTH12-03764 [Blumeria graminis f. sp. triticale]VCU39821.1 BgtA-20421 [Blumeria graminis f. sp. tritici]
MSVAKVEEKTRRASPSPQPSAPFDLAKYQRLNRSIWYYVPEKQPSTPTGAPSVILLAGWMAATPRHISKYSAGYSALYPHARIIAITTTPWDMFPIDCISGGVGRVQPILDILYGLQPYEKVLMHTMSNGGIMTSVYIARLFKEFTGRLLPISAIVLDSAPGKATWSASVKAFGVVIPNNFILIFLGYALIYFLFGIYCGIYKLFNMLDGVAEGRIEFNNPELFDVQTPRLYIYSESDPIVDWNDVEEHAHEAEETGYQVMYEKFTESGHAGHLMVDANRYWGTVRRMWEKINS